MVTERRAPVLEQFRAATKTARSAFQLALVTGEPVAIAAGNLPGSLTHAIDRDEARNRARSSNVRSREPSPIACAGRTPTARSPCAIVSVRGVSRAARFPGSKLSRTPIARRTAFIADLPGHARAVRCHPPRLARLAGGRAIASSRSPSEERGRSACSVPDGGARDREDEATLALHCLKRLLRGALWSGAPRFGRRHPVWQHEDGRRERHDRDDLRLHRDQDRESSNGVRLGERSRGFDTLCREMNAPVLAVDPSALDPTG